MIDKQNVLIQKEGIINYPKEQINYIFKDIQRIETSRGCPHNCPFCYEIQDLVIFPIPKLITKKIQILDMNFLYQPNILKRINELGSLKKDYEAVCGIDYRLLTFNIAKALRKANFRKIRIAWDWYVKDQVKIKEALSILLQANYDLKDLSCFMIINWKIPKKECDRKLDILKVWNIKVCDCCFDGGYKYAIPRYWSMEEIKEFRSKCRKHNQLINFRIDPEEL